MAKFEYLVLEVPAKSDKVQLEQADARKLVSSSTLLRCTCWLHLLLTPQQRKLSRSPSLSSINSKVLYPTTEIRELELIHRVVLNHYHALRRKSLDLFEIDLVISQASNGAVPQTMVGTNHPRFKFQQGWALPIEPPVRVRIGGESGFKVELEIDNIWTDMEDWMTTLIQPEPIFDAVRNRDSMYRWWRFNGKFFRILDLPGELREAITKYALFLEGDYTVIPYRLLLGGNRVFYPQRPHTMGLLLTSKQIAHEAAHLLYDKGRFIFYARRSFERFLYRTSKKTLDRLQHIELRMTHLEYIEMFGGLFRIKTSRTEDRPPERLWGCVETHKLNALSNLQELTFHICHPAQILPDLPLHNKDNLDFLEYVFHPFCQKHIVDFILRLAAPYMYRLHHRVEVTGYAKHFQKEQFKAILVSFAHREDAWVHEIELADDEEEGGVGGTGKAPYVTHGTWFPLTKAWLDFMNALHFMNHQRAEPPGRLDTRIMDEIDAEKKWQFTKTKNGTRAYSPIVPPYRVPANLYELNWKGTDFGWAGLKFDVRPRPCRCKSHRCDQTELPELWYWVEDIKPENEGKDDAGEQA